MNQLHDIFLYGDYRAMRVGVGSDIDRSDGKYYHVLAINLASDKPKWRKLSGSGNYTYNELDKAAREMREKLRGDNHQLSDDEAYRLFGRSHGGGCIQDPPADCEAIWDAIMHPAHTETARQPDSFTNPTMAPVSPADAGAATQNRSSVKAVSLAPDEYNSCGVSPTNGSAPGFDYSALDPQTVATLRSAEQIIRNTRKDYIFKMADAVGMAHDELVQQLDGHNQHSEETFVGWCRSVGLGKSTAYNLLQVSDLLDQSTPNEQKILEQASATLLYAVAKPNAPVEAVAAVKSGDITTSAEYRRLLQERDLIEVDRNAQLREKLRLQDVEQELARQRNAAQDESRRKGEDIEIYAHKLRELESRPIDVAVQQPSPAEIECLAGEKAREMTSMLRAQVHGLQDDLEDARRITGGVENSAFKAAHQYARQAYSAIHALRAGFFALAQNLSENDFQEASRPIREAAKSIVDNKWNDEEEPA